MTQDTPNTSPRIILPTRGNYDYLELPPELQLLITAADALDTASDALESAERHSRELELSADPARRDEWRWYQAVSLQAYRLHEHLQLRAELAYITWLIEREREEGQGSRAQLASLTTARLRLLAQGE
ncbi:MAG TPA: hypothetical protein VID72_07645 [Ktedonobacterales bacterium]|jgi:hypothetical protein